MKQSQTFMGWAINVALYVVLLDMMVETFLAGSPIRWIVAGIVAAYAAIAFLLWKRASLVQKILASLVMLGILIAYSGWKLGSLGTTGGIVVAHQSAAVVAAAFLIATFVLAAVAFVFNRPLSLWVRAGGVAVCLYLIFAAAASLRDGSGGLGGALAGMTAPPSNPFWLRGSYLMVEIALPLLLVAGLVTAATTVTRRGQGLISALLIAVATLLAIQIGAYEAGAQGLPTIVAFEHPQPQVACDSSANSLDSVAPGASKLGQMGFGATASGQSGNALSGNALSGGTPDSKAQPNTSCANASSGATTANAPVSNDKFASDLSQTFDALQANDASVPRDSYDPQAVVDRVGRDPAKLFEWVRDNTRLAAYQGALRGSEGVLMDHVGSSLDRSLLLAQLELLAGQQARLARAHLSESQARAILAAMQQAGPFPAATPPALDGAANSGGAQGDAALDAWLREERARRDALNAQVAMLTPLVSSSSRDDAAEQAADLTAIEDHWWVQVNNGGTWSDFDPSPGAAPGKTLSAPLSTMPAQQLDPNLFHQLEIRVVGESWDDNKFDEHVALDYTLRPMELIDQPIVLTFKSTDSGDAQTGTTLAEKIKALALGANQWQPVLRVGDRTISQGSFTNGVPGELTAVWLDFVLLAPGSAPEVVRREVMDVRGPAARAASTQVAPTITDSLKLERGVALLGEVQVLPMVSDVSPQFVLHQSSQALLANRDLLMRAESAGRAASPADLTSAIIALNSEPSALYGLALARQSLSPVRPDRYLGHINVSSTFTRPEINGNLLVSQQIVDFANNEIAVRAGAASPARVRLEQGVADTFAEQAALADARPGQNTADLFSTNAADAKPLVLTRDRDSSLQDLEISPDARARLEEDLAASYTAVAPSRPVELDGKKRFGWWRVSAASGDSIGVMETGYHQDTLESVEDTVVPNAPDFEPCHNGFSIVGMVGPQGDVLRAMMADMSTAIQGAWFLGMAELHKRLLAEKYEIFDALHKC